MAKKWSQGFDRVESDRKVKITSNRKFGVSVGLVFVVLGMISSKPGVRTICIGVGSVLVLGGLLVPEALRKPKEIWFLFGDRLHRVVAPVIAGVLFFVALTPLAIMAKIFGRDALRVKKKNTTTYWIPKDAQVERDRNHFKYQF